MMWRSVAFVLFTSVLGFNSSVLLAANPNVQDQIDALTGRVDTLETRVTDLENAGGGGDGNSTKVEFVGFSTGSAQGNAGLAGFAALCRPDYGAGARLCTSAEIIASSNLTSQTSSTYAWVHPSFSGLVNDGGKWVLEASGVFRPFPGGLNGGLSCKGWSVADTTDGLIVDDNLSFVDPSLYGDCNNSYRVACCK